MQNFKIMVRWFIKRQNKVWNAHCVYIMFQKLIIIIYWRKYLLLFDKMFIFIKVKSSMARSHPVENLYYHRMWVNYQLLAVMLLKLPNGLLPVAVDRSHLRTVASEPADPIDWQLTPPLTGQYPGPWAPRLHGENEGYKWQDRLKPVGGEHDIRHLIDWRPVNAPWHV